jgi:hypothetical protein
MAVNRRSRHRVAAEGLSFDSLIDVFMNVLGVLMITAVVLALATPGQQSSPQETAAPPPQPPPAVTVPERPPVQLSLPQVEEAATRPLYLLVTGDGIRPFSGDDLATTSRYFNISDLGMQTVLRPIPGRVMGSGELRSWLRQHDPASTHLTAAITPEGAGYYREVRSIAAAEGFRSGWLDHDGDEVVLGPGGRSGSLVQ